MSQEPRVRGVLRPSILIGAAVWLALALASFAPGVHLGIIEVLFLLGPWIVVPLGADLLRGAGVSKGNAVRDWMLFTAGSLTTVSFSLDNRTAAAWFASVCVLVCAVFACDGLRRFVNAGRKSFTQFCFAAGEGYLLVAGRAASFGVSRANRFADRRALSFCGIRFRRTCRADVRKIP